MAHGEDGDCDDYNNIGGEGGQREAGPMTSWTGGGDATTTTTTTAAATMMAAATTTTSQ